MQAMQVAPMTDVDFKKVLGVLIVLLVAVLFAICINIVITLMKPTCKCPPFMMPFGANAPYF